MPDVNILINAVDKASGPFSNVNAAILALNASGMAAAKGGLFSLQNVIGVTLVASALAATAALGGLVSVIASSVGKAAAMEQGIANIGATMQLTDQEMVKLEDHIMKLALDPNLVVSTTEASDAIMALGQAGLSMTEIIGGASTATVLLANATGSDFKSAANIATDVMAQFNIKAEDMDEAIDQIVGTTVASKMTIDDYRYAIGMAGGVAGMVGVTFEDFNAIIAATAPSFTSGSDAGTSYKTFLMALVPSTNKAMDEMRRLGLFTQETGSAFFDANGNMKSAIEISDLLKVSFGGLTDAQKIESAQVIFGRDAMRTALALAEGGIPIINSMKAAIGKTDAEESAARRMDTFSGAISIAKDIIGAISIGIGNQFLPVLRPLIETFSILASTHGPQLVAFFGGIADRMAVVIARVGSMVSGFTTMKLVYEDGAGALMNFFQQLGFTDEAAQAVGKAFWDLRETLENVMSVIRAAIAPIVDAIGKFVKWQDVMVALARFAVPAVLAAIGGLIVSLGSFLAPILAVTAVVAALRWAWENDWGRIRTYTLSTLEKISGWFYNESGLWKGTWEDTWEYLVYRADRLIRIDLYNLIVGTWAEIRFQTKFHFVIIRDIIIAWVNEVVQNVTNWKDRAVGVFVGFKNNVIDTVKDWTGPIILDIEQWISRTLSQFNQFVAASLAHWENLKEDAIEIWNEWFGWFKPVEWYLQGVAIVQGLWNGVQELWGRFMDWWIPKWESVKEQFEKVFGIGSPSTVFHAYGESWMDGLAGGIVAGLPGPQEAMQLLANNVGMGVNDFMDKIAVNIQTKTPAVVEAVTSMAQGMAAAMTRGVETMNNFALDQMMQKIKDMTDKPRAEMESRMNSVTAIAERARKMALNYETMWPRTGVTKNLVKDLNLDPATMLPAAGGTGKIIGMIPSSSGGFGTALLEGAGNKLPGATRPFSAMPPRPGEITTPGFPDTSAQETERANDRFKASINDMLNKLSATLQGGGMASVFDSQDVYVEAAIDRVLSGLTTKIKKAGGALGGVTDLNVFERTMLDLGKSIEIIFKRSEADNALFGNKTIQVGLKDLERALVERLRSGTIDVVKENSATTNNFSINLQGSASASDDLMSTFNLLNSMYGTAP